MGINADMRIGFQRAVLARCGAEARTVLVDTTSISTYPALDGWANYGHHRDLEPKTAHALGLVNPLLIGHCMGKSKQLIECQLFMYYFSLKCSQ